jgi:hypothetical protein
VQLPRYWRFIRATNRLSVFYNASVLNEPSVQDMRLLGLRYLVVPTSVTPPLPGRIVERAGHHSLWELYEAQPVATFTNDVVSVDDLARALDAVTAPGFDPSRQVVVERPSDIASEAGDPAFATAAVESSSLTELRFSLEASGGGILTVRNAFDPGWRAEVDGGPARTLPVDGFLQGVVVTEERPRAVVLTYHDDAVMLGLAVGGAVWLLLLAAPFVALVLERRANDLATRSEPPAA